MLCGLLGAMVAGFARHRTAPRAPAPRSGGWMTTLNEMTPLRDRTKLRAAWISEGDAFQHCLSGGLEFRYAIHTSEGHQGTATDSVVFL